MGCPIRPIGSDDPNPQTSAEHIPKPDFTITTILSENKAWILSGGMERMKYVLASHRF
jgi:hypothetical protein